MRLVFAERCLQNYGGNACIMAGYVSGLDMAQASAPLGPYHEVVHLLTYLCFYSAGVTDRACMSVKRRQQLP